MSAFEIKSLSLRLQFFFLLIKSNLNICIYSHIQCIDKRIKIFCRHLSYDWYNDLLNNESIKYFCLVIIAIDNISCLFWTFKERKIFFFFCLTAYQIAKLCIHKGFDISKLFIIGWSCVVDSYLVGVASFVYCWHFNSIYNE